MSARHVPIIEYDRSVRTLSRHPREGGDPVFQRRLRWSREARRTGYSAFAEYDGQACGKVRAMILIGQYDSPFVRRVAIAMRLYGIAFEHRPWSTFGDADKIAPFNPLRRVPTLVLDDGEALIESAMILDYLDDRRRPRQGDDRAQRRDAAAAFADLRAGDGSRRQGRQPAVRARAAEGEAARSLGRALQVADIGRAGGAGKGAR